MFDVIREIAIRDISIYMKNKGELIRNIYFFLVIVSLFPMVLGPDLEKLSWMGGGIIWIAALLSILLFQENLFRSDYNSGIFEQLILSKHSLSVLICIKVIVNWFVSGFPLFLITPLLGVIFNLSINTIIVLSLSILIGTPALCMISNIGVALTISLSRSGLLLIILVIPLYMPVLILATMATFIASSGFFAIGHLLLLMFISIISIIFAPIAIASALKISLI